MCSTDEERHSLSCYMYVPLLQRATRKADARRKENEREIEHARAFCYSS